MARGDQLSRQWKIIQHLIHSRLGKTVPDIAARLDCHPRTVYRDLEALQAAGFPLITRRDGHKQCWSLMEGSKHALPLPLNLSELMALYFSRHLLGSLRQGVFADALGSLFDKVQTNLAPEYRRYLDRFFDAVKIRTTPILSADDAARSLQVLNEAIAGHVHVDLTYYAPSRKQRTRRRVAPYQIWCFNGRYYLVAFCTLRDDIRIFAIDRIQALDTTAQPFDPPTDFSIDDYMNGSFGVFSGEPTRVRIRFSAHVADYVQEVSWHSSQRFDLEDEGAVVLTMAVAVTNELERWVLSWGGDAKVLEPLALREKIRSEAQRMLKT